MKTAQDWNWEHTKICANDPAVHGQLLPTPQMVKFITRVQLDAKESGIETGIDLYHAACALMRNQGDKACWHNLQNSAARWEADRQAARNDAIEASNTKASE